MYASAKERKNRGPIIIYYYYNYLILLLIIKII